MGRFLLPWILTLVALSSQAADVAPLTGVVGRVGEMSLSVADPEAAPRGSSTLRVLVWYPALPDARERPVDVGPAFDAGHVATGAPWRQDRARFPLVLLSHGFGGTGRQMTWLGEALARHGYVAVAVDHPGTNGIDGITPTGAYAPWERATDMRLLLDHVLGDAALQTRIDPQRVAIIGFSMGAWTAALMAGARADFDLFRTFCHGPDRDSICNRQVEFPLDYDTQRAALRRAGSERLLDGELADHRDDRVKAVVLIAPGLVQALTPASVARIKIPMLIVSGGADAIAPSPSNSDWLAARVPGARRMEMPTAGHYDFLSLCTPAGKTLVPPLCREGEIPRSRIHALAVSAVLEFLGGVFKEVVPTVKPPCGPFVHRPE